MKEEYKLMVVVEAAANHVPIRLDVARHKADKDKYLGETKKLNKI